MDWKPRLMHPTELRATADVLTTAFGISPTVKDDQYAELEAAGEVDRTFVVDEGPRIVGTGTAYTFAVAVPGGNVPMAGVSWVAVLPTHRRQGVLTAVMEALMDDAAERGEPLAGLTATEGTIYRRYGFGVATQVQTLVVDCARSTLIRNRPDPGRVRLVGAEDAATVLPAAWDLHWRRTPGEVSRTPGYWPALAIDVEDDRQGAGPRFIAVHEAPDGGADGFATYRFKELEGSGPAGNELCVETVAGADDGVESALLRYLMDVDLAPRLRWWNAPLDPTLRWQLADPRAMEVAGQSDYLWLRPLDVPRCLTSRTYAAEGGAVLDITDPIRPEVGGHFMLDAGPDGADCTRTTAEADVRLAIADLGALYLGGVSWPTLWRAGLVEELSPGAIDRLDRLFRPDRAPHCATGF